MLLGIQESMSAPDGKCYEIESNSIGCEINQWNWDRNVGNRDVMRIMQISGHFLTKAT